MLPADRRLPKLVCKPTGHFLLTSVYFAAFCLVLLGCDAIGEGGDAAPPDSPTGLSAQSQDSKISLDWNDVQAEDLAGYNVYRSTSSIGDISDLTPVNGNSPVTQANYADDRVENGTTYHYVVTAVDEAENESESSGKVEKTPFPGPPDRP